MKNVINFLKIFLDYLIFITPFLSYNLMHLILILIFTIIFLYNLEKRIGSYILFQIFIIYFFIIILLNFITFLFFRILGWTYERFYQYYGINILNPRIYRLYSRSLTYLFWFDYIK
jgi:membrane associated rhomboid family serine protease